jgi:hypothetical protein
MPGSQTRAIIKVHNYLYRFSLERLEYLIKDVPVITLFRYYFENHAKERIESSTIMRKFKEAYFEAGDHILSHKPEKRIEKVDNPMD